jgi:hypothetical protein
MMVGAQPKKISKETAFESGCIADIGKFVKSHFLFCP